MYYILQFFVILREFSFAFHWNNLVLWILVWSCLFLFFCITIIHERYSLKKYIFLILFTLPFVLYNKYAFSFISVVLYAYIFRTINLRKIIIFSLGVWFLFLVISAYLLEIGYNTNEIRDGFWKGKGLLYTFGLTTNPNLTSRLFLSPVIYLYIFARILKYKPLGLFIHVLNICLCILIFQYTGSRTVFFIEILIYMFAPLFRKRKTGFGSLLLYLPLVLLVCAFILPLILGDNALLNAIVTRRFEFGKRSLNLLRPINILIGLRIEDDSIINDSSYLGLFFGNGLLGIIFFVSIYLRFIKTIILNYPYWQKSYIWLPVIIVLSIGGFTEGILTVLRDITPIYFIVILSATKYNIKNKKNITN